MVASKVRLQIQNMLGQSGKDRSENFICSFLTYGPVPNTKPFGGYDAISLYAASSQNNECDEQ
jgi:hypothetical protein